MPVSAMMMSGSGAGAAPPDPTAIFSTDLLAWYKRGTAIYDSLVGGALCVSNGQEIGRWEDQSGNGYHIIRNSAINVGHIQYNTSVTNLGQPTLDNVASTTTDILKIPDALGSALSSAAKGAVWICLKTSGTHIGAGIWKVGTSGSDALYDWSDGHIYDDWGSTVRKDTGIPAIDISAAFRRYHVYSNASDWRNYLNGTLNFSTATNTVAFKTSGLTLYPKAYISEVVVVKVVPTGTQQSQMDTYLST